MGGYQENDNGVVMEELTVIQQIEVFYGEPEQDKQRRFLIQYLLNGYNVSKAGEGAGYKDTSNWSTCYQFLKRPEVRNFIKAFELEQQRKFQIDHDTVIQELAAIAFLDPLDLLSEDGSVRRLRDIPVHARKAIAGMKIKELFDRDGDLVGMMKDLKLVNKDKAIELLGKNLKLWVDKVEHSVNDDLAQAILDARSRSVKKESVEDCEDILS